MIEESKTALRVSIPSDLAELDGVCAAAIILLNRNGQISCAFAISLLLREFMNNAVLHGNLRDPSKRVTASVRIGRRWITVDVSDEGPGFDWRKAKRVVPDEFAVGGRGLAIGAAYSERMRFSRAGNRVTLWIRKTV